MYRKQQGEVLYPTKQRAQPHRCNNRVEAGMVLLTFYNIKASIRPNFFLLRAPYGSTRLNSRPTFRRTVEHVEGKYAATRARANSKKNRLQRERLKECAARVSPSARDVIQAVFEGNPLLTVPPAIGVLRRCLASEVGQEPEEPYLFLDLPPPIRKPPEEPGNKQGKKGWF